MGGCLGTRWKERGASLSRRGDGSPGRRTRRSSCHGPTQCVKARRRQQPRRDDRHSGTRSGRPRPSARGPPREYAMVGMEPPLPAALAARDHFPPTQGSPAPAGPTRPFPPHRLRRQAILRRLTEGFPKRGSVCFSWRKTTPRSLRTHKVGLNHVPK